jgi:8-oxo-dGTP diphosphatase
LIHVAVAVIKNPRQEVLVALRRPDSHQGGLWEFPGGKVEKGESVFTALQREIQEELDLSITAAFPLIKISHDYGDKRVLLDVWQVTEFGGNAIGREGQQIQWLPAVDMRVQDFPAANRRIIDLLKLPLEMAITPALQELPALSEYLEKVAAADVKLIQLRQKQLPTADLLKWADHAQALGERLGLKMVVNAPVDLIPMMPGGMGLHLSATELGKLTAPLAKPGFLLGCSCHSQDELRRAEALSVDYALLSPVAEIAKYPAAAALGWSGLAELAADVNVPVYALGGLQRKDLEIAQSMGAVGIAGISMYP